MTKSTGRFRTGCRLTAPSEVGEAVSVERVEDGIDELAAVGSSTKKVTGPLPSSAATGKGEERTGHKHDASERRHQPAPEPTKRTPGTSEIPPLKVSQLHVASGSRW